MARCSSRGKTRQAQRLLNSILLVVKGNLSWLDRTYSCVIRVAEQKKELRRVAGESGKLGSEQARRVDIDTPFLGT